MPNPSDYFDYYGTNPMYMYEFLVANNVIEKIEDMDESIQVWAYWMMWLNLWRLQKPTAKQEKDFASQKDKFFRQVRSIKNKIVYFMKYLNFVVYLLGYRSGHTISEFQYKKCI